MINTLIAIFIGFCFGTTFGYFIATITWSAKQFEDQLKCVDKIVNDYDGEKYERRRRP
jgi:hypothetical protein